MQKTSAGDLGSNHHDFSIVIATMPASAWQRKIASGSFVILIAIVAITIPFANIRLVKLDAFVPAVQTVMCVADLLTAVFLFAQYSVQPQRTVLVLASGYMCSGTFAFLQTLAFPGAYAAAGLIGDALNTPGWLFVFWHTSFPLTIIVYTLSKNRIDARSRTGQSTSVDICVAIACVAMVTVTLTLVATMGVGYLPSLYETAIRQTPYASYVNLYLSILSATALALLFARRHTVLDQWLVVVLLAWLPNFVVAVLFTVVRFTVGWYASRLYALVAGSSLTFALLAETVVLYTRVADANTLLLRERENKLLSAQAIIAAIAHEVRQPLAGIVSSADAALRFIQKTPIEQNRAREILERIARTGHRISDIFDGIRDLFGARDQERQPLNLNHIVLDALRSFRSELEDRQIEVQTELMSKPPPVVDGNRNQLQQVISNLLLNAVEAMDVTKGPRRILRVKTAPIERNMVAATLEDSGPGIDPQQLESIFKAFITTKLHGMGLGLPICRMIAEQHGGHLTAFSDGKTGARLQLVLPIKPTAKPAVAEPGRSDHLGIR